MIMASLKNCFEKSPYGSTKHSHYFEIYEQLFSQLPKKNITLIEIGVLNGGSLFMWRKYFGKNARIIGIDMNPEAKIWQDHGFEIFIGNQTNENFINETLKKIGKFDIFIDDGGHTNVQQAITLKSLINHINFDTLLIFEDTHTSYQAEFGNPSRLSFSNLSKKFIDIIHTNNNKSLFAKETYNKVFSIEYFDSIIAFKVKKKRVDKKIVFNDAFKPQAEDFRHQNVFFYKIKRNSSATSDSEKAVPIELYSGISKIIVDSGNFVGQSRMTSEENTTVYDLAVEYEDIGGARRFYLYINNVIVAIVDDPDPLPTYNNMAIFVRGAAQCMFENIYSLTENYSQNTGFATGAPVRSAFGDEEINANKSFRKYAMSGLIQSTYLSGISATEPPRYNIFFEEFGTIMREASYFDIRYDKAYPALSAKISPTFNRIKGYTVSGFRAGSYGAEFLVFNNTDSALSLDSSSGNYLRIQGVTFTQQSDNELSVDEYFNKIGNLSDPEFSYDRLISSPEVEKEKYRDIKLSRITQGRSSFSIDAPYIQDQDTADGLMSWLTERVMKPRKSVGVEVFGLPILQLGDIVQVRHTNENGVNEIATENSRFVIYYIDYSRAESGPTMNLYLSEVL